MWCRTIPSWKFCCSGKSSLLSRRISRSKTYCHSWSRCFSNAIWSKMSDLSSLRRQVTSWKTNAHLQAHVIWQCTFSCYFFSIMSQNSSILKTLIGWFYTTSSFKFSGTLPIRENFAIFYCFLLYLSNKRDELSIFFDDGTPLCPPLSGNRFPSTPCLIRGNSIMLHFESGSDKKRKLWGYKLTVTGWKMFREIKMPRMVDMYRTLCHLVGKVNTFLLSVDYVFFSTRDFPGKK